LKPANRFAETDLRVKCMLETAAADAGIRPGLNIVLALKLQLHTQCAAASAASATASAPSTACAALPSLAPLVWLSESMLEVEVDSVAIARGRRHIVVISRAVRCWIIGKRDVRQQTFGRRIDSVLWNQIIFKRKFRQRIVDRDRVSANQRLRQIAV